MRYGEILEQIPSGNSIYSAMIYTDNLRGAAATDVYTFRGDSQGEVFEPRFTVHGFR